MILILKALGATCLAGAVAAGGAVSTDYFVAGHDPAPATATAPDPAIEAEVDAMSLLAEETEQAETTTTTEAPTTTTTEAPTTTTTTDVDDPMTILPAAEAGNVEITINGPVLIVNQVHVKPGWVVSDIARNGDEVVVTFKRGDNLLRFLAHRDGSRLAAKIARAGDDVDGDRGKGQNWDKQNWDKQNWDKQKDGRRDRR